MVITSAANRYLPNNRPAAAQQAPTRSASFDSFQPRPMVEPPPPGYNPNDPASAKIQGVVGLGLLGGLAGIVAGAAGGTAGAIAGAVALGAAGATAGAFGGLAFDIGNLGSSNITPYATAGGAALGIIGGALLGANTAGPLAAAGLGLLGAAGAGLGANMLLDPQW
ncbi:MAG: hypothetical protein AB7S38_33410 [Vulcanimicrobiota bacterium]